MIKSNIEDEILDTIVEQASERSKRTIMKLQNRDNILKNFVKAARNLSNVLHSLERKGVNLTTRENQVWRDFATVNELFHEILEQE